MESCGSIKTFLGNRKGCHYVHQYMFTKERIQVNKKPPQIFFETAFQKNQFYQEIA